MQNAIYKSAPPSFNCLATRHLVLSEIIINFVEYKKQYNNILIMVDFELDPKVAEAAGLVIDPVLNLYVPKVRKGFKPPEKNIPTVTWPQGTPAPAQSLNLNPGAAIWNKIYLDKNALAKNIWHSENSIKKGYDPITDTWSPHKSIEGGADTIGPGLKTINKERAEIIKSYNNKVPTSVLNTWLAEEITDNEAALKKHFGDKWNDLDGNVKAGLIDMRHQLGSLGEFKKLLKAVEDKDLTALQAESKTYYKSNNGQKVFDKGRYDFRLKNYFQSFQEGGRFQYYIPKGQEGLKTQWGAKTAPYEGVPAVVKRSQTSPANFIQRMLSQDPQSIPDWSQEGYHSTVKMASSEDNEGNGVIFPMVQKDPKTGKLIDYTRPPYRMPDAGYNKAVQNGDTIQTDPRTALEFGQEYKYYYPGFQEYGTPIKKK